MKRIAVVAVHGVADQKPNETARAMANLLANLQTPDGPAYGPFVEERIDVPVRRIDVPRESNASGTFYDRAGRLRERQGLTIDIDGRCEFDAGLEFMSTLLADYAVEGPEETFHTVVVHGTRARTRDRDAVDVDVYEMYWADLSRLTSSVFRIFAEVHQLLSHLSLLSVHVVTAAQAFECDVKAPWNFWAWAQRNASECLSNYILLLNLMFVGLGVVLVPNAAPEPLVAPLAWAIGGLLVTGLAAYGYFRAGYRSRWLWFIPLVALATAIALAYLVTRRPQSWLAGHAYQMLTTEALLVAGSLVTLVIVLYNRQHPGVVESGRMYGVLFGGFLVWNIWTAASSPDDMVTAVFRDIEAVYIVLVVVWALFILFSWGTLYYGWRANRAARGTAAADRVRRATWTARLALALPAALHLIMTIVLWYVLWSASTKLFRDACYEPIYLARLLPPDAEHSANEFIRALIQNGAALGFGLLVALAAVAAALAVYAVAPIVVTEVFPYKRTIDGTRTGVWLDHGLRLLRQSARLLVIGTFVVLPAGAVILVVRRLSGEATQLLALNRVILTYAGALLVPAAAGLLTFGGRLKSLALGFRNVVDVLLDVDNYLREHPIDSAPRARICARFVSLLRYVYGQPYDAFVVIAHSQGTVIAGDLLRFIKAARLEERDSGLSQRRDRPISFFTMGSPLRQLYGLRFPHFYRWARHELTTEWTDPETKIDPRAVPDPAQLSVAAWVNTYRSGDYVGRYLWRPERCTFSYNTVDGKIVQPWRIDAYRRAIASVTDAPITRREFCIGAGAHTHYWDRTAPQVAVQLDELIVG